MKVHGRKDWLVEAFHDDDVVEAATSGPLNIGHCQRLRRSGVILLWVSCKAHKISTLSIDGAAVMPNAAWRALPTWIQTEMLPRPLQSRTNWQMIDLQEIAKALHSDKGFFAKDAIEWPVGVVNHKHTLLVWGVEFKVADVSQTTSKKKGPGLKRPTRRLCCRQRSRQNQRSPRLPRGKAFSVFQPEPES